MHKAVEKIIGILLWLPATFVVMAELGVDPITSVIALSGAIGSLALILGTFHSTFMQSFMMVAFNTPFKIGDRLLIDGMRSYVTQMRLFHTVNGGADDIIHYIPYTVLNTMELINDTPTKRAVFHNKFWISDQTSAKKIECLRSLCSAFVAIRPYYFVTDGFYLKVSAHQPGHYIELDVYACYRGSWHYWMRVARSRNEFIFFVLRCCQVLRIQYAKPVQPIALVETSNQKLDCQKLNLGWEQFIDDHVEYKTWNAKNVVPRLNPDVPICLDHPIYQEGWIDDPTPAKTGGTESLTNFTHSLDESASLIGGNNPRVDYRNSILSLLREREEYSGSRCRSDDRVHRMEI